MGSRKSWGSRAKVPGRVWQYGGAGQGGVRPSAAAAAKSFRTGSGPGRRQSQSQAGGCLKDFYGAALGKKQTVGAWL